MRLFFYKNTLMTTLLFCLFYSPFSFSSDATPIAVSSNVVEVTASVDITSFTLLPHSDLLAGNYTKGSEVAGWSATLSDSARIAFRCTPGKSVVDNSTTDATSCVFQNSAATKQLPVMFSYPGNMQVTNINSGSGYWTVSNNAALSFNGGIIISSTTNISAGIYTLSYDAAVYSP